MNLMRRAVQVGFVLALAACAGDPVEPVTADPDALRLDVPRTLIVGPDDTTSVTFRTTAPIAALLEIQAVAGTSSAAMFALPSGDLLVTATVAPGETSIITFAAPAGVAFRWAFSAVGATGATVRVLLLGADPAPERVPAVLLLGDSVSGEALDGRADADEFVLDLPAGSDVKLFGQGPPASTRESVVVDLIEPSGATPLPALLLGGEPGLDRARMPTYASASAVRLRVVVRRLNPFPQAPVSAPFRLFARRIDRAPEHVSPLVPLGTLVTGEEADYIGDVDEFRFVATAEEEFNLHLQSLTTSFNALFEATLYRRGVLQRTLLTGVPPEPTPRASGRFAPGVTDSFVLRFESPDGFTNRPLGPYQFRLLPVHLLPEQVPPTIPLGDSVVGEAIDTVGDVDDFRLMLPADTNIALHVRRAPIVAPPIVADPARVVVFQGGNAIAVSAPLGVAPGAPPDSTSGTTLLRLPGGMYRIRVEGGGDGTGGFTGPYRLVTYAVGTGPERAPTQVQPGDTIEDAIAPAADEDRYRFRGRAGESILVCLQHLGRPGEGGLIVSVQTPFAFPQLIGGVVVPGQDPDHCRYQTGRIDLPADTVYTLRVAANNEGRIANEQGPYRLSLNPFPTRPESVGDTVMPGDSVVGEQIDFHSDADIFVVRAAAGTELQAWLQMSPNPGNQNFATLEALAPGGFAATRSIIANYAIRAAIGRLTVPAAGTLRLRVQEPRQGCELFCTWYTRGPYRLWVTAIDRSPEGRPATFTPGDTVADALEIPGDIDEYTFVGQSGDTIQVRFQALQAGWEGGHVVSVFAPFATTPLATVQVPTYAPDFRFTTARLVLSTTGTYMIRVEGRDDRYAVGPYRFVVVRAP